MLRSTRHEIWFKYSLAMRQHCALSPRPSWDSVHQLCQLLLDQVIPTPLLPYTAVYSLVYAAARWHLLSRLSASWSDGNDSVRTAVACHNQQRNHQLIDLHTSRIVFSQPYTNGRAYATMLSPSVCNVLWLNGASYQKKLSEEVNRKWCMGNRWPHDRWRHVTLKGHDPNTLRAQYLENSEDTI